ncbi:hypothetical protein AMECASPLE_012844 [Ameca splendens]|uniref:RING-type E3 ubiquitin transferase n=1 Tax=Ameca splendens TaxID=208324 RepID=A0ABV0XQ96_9TELE
MTLITFSQHHVRELSILLVIMLILHMSACDIPSYSGGHDVSSALFSSVCVGRWLMSLWMGSAVVHELYTAASGLYICWVSIRAATVLLSWMPQGRTVIMIKVHEWTLMVMSVSVSASPMTKTPSH